MDEALRICEEAVSTLSKLMLSASCSRAARSKLLSLSSVNADISSADSLFSILLPLAALVRLDIRSDDEFLAAKLTSRLLVVDDIEDEIDEMDPERSRSNISDVAWSDEGVDAADWLLLLWLVEWARLVNMCWLSVDRP
jgi:hypothetical protein